MLNAFTSKLVARNIEEITKLDNLEMLMLGIYEMKEPDILQAKTFQRLNVLGILETKSKELNLECLRNYDRLKLLVVGGHSKNIEAIADVGSLRYLGLNSIKKTSLNFINHLRNLKGLHIILGGRENLHEIEENEIEDLEIIWVRGFNDLSNIGKFRELKTLLVEDQIRLEKIHFSTAMPELRDIEIVNCKKLRTLTGLENLPTLNQLRIAQTNIDFQDFRRQSFPQSLKTVAMYTGRENENNRIREELSQMGYSEY